MNSNEEREAYFRWLDRQYSDEQNEAATAELAEYRARLDHAPVTGRRVG